MSEEEKVINENVVKMPTFYNNLKNVKKAKRGTLMIKRAVCVYGCIILY